MVVISEEFARRARAGARGRAGASAFGLRVDQSEWREVIGVVQSIREVGLYESPAHATVYWPALMTNFYGPRVGEPGGPFAIRSERPAPRAS